MACFLKSGSIGDKVRKLQERLRFLGFYKRQVDGIFGKYTKAAVIAYQKQKKLIVDGCVGDQTWGSLFPKVTINPAAKPTVVASDKDATLAAIATAIGGKFNTFTEFYNLIKKEFYAKYLNDIYPQAAAIERLKKNLPLNCADFSQIGYYVATVLGYEVKYVHIRCASGLGHIALMIRGKELGLSWKIADLAAAADSDTQLGKYWCSTGSIESYDDEWLKSDDGKT